MTTTTCGYDIAAIQPSVTASLHDLDDAGRRPPTRVDDVGGAPLRCCLRRSRSGEAITLASYAPLRRWAIDTGVDPGAYDEVGPVFIHGSSCPGPDMAGFPGGMVDGRRVFRCYDATGAILSGRLVEPHEPHERILDELFADQTVALVHVRAVEFGCFLFEVRRRRS